MKKLGTVRECRGCGCLLLGGTKANGLCGRCVRNLRWHSAIERIRRRYLIYMYGPGGQLRQAALLILLTLAAVLCVAFASCGGRPADVCDLQPRYRVEPDARNTSACPVPLEEWDGNELVGGCDGFIAAALPEHLPTGQVADCHDQHCLPTADIPTCVATCAGSTCRYRYYEREVR